MRMARFVVVVSVPALTAGPMALNSFPELKLQAERRASSPEEVERATFDRLFRGIRLDSAKAVLVKRIIHEEQEAQTRLDRADPKVFSKRMALTRQRDSTLRAAIPAGDRKTFDANSRR